MKDNEYVIADNVRFYRKKANLTQAQLAERAELSLDSIKRVEAGKRTMSLENFLRLSDALGIPLTFLLYGQKDRMPDEERIRGILEGRSDGQKEYLLHMLQEMADGHDGDAAWDKPSQCMLPGSGRNESEFILSEET